MSTISEELLNPSFETVEKPVRALNSEDIQKAEDAELQGVQPPAAQPTEAAESQTEASVAERAPASLGHGGFGRVDDHTGAYSYGIQVFVPTPQNGAPAPRLAIVYNSMASKSPSLIGAGWRLELGRISRVTLHDQLVNFKNDQGSEQSSDYFVLELNGHTHTLVKVRNHEHKFRLKIEQSYAEAVRFLSDRIDPKSGEPEIDYWEVYLADGSKFRYGIAGDGGEQELAGELRNKVWNLISAENSYGHKVVYEYDSYKKNVVWKEMAYSYPARIRIGVTPDGEFWDSLIEFIYEEDPPSEQNGYYNLGIDYTGRENENLDGWTCILWRRLTEIRTLYRDETGNFRPARSIRIGATFVDGLFQVERVEEVGYGDVETGAQGQPLTHRFTYISKGEHHPALMATATDPMGKIDEVGYDLAIRLDNGTSKAVEDLYLVETITERIEGESWKKLYRYWDCKRYTPFEEYRGHSRVDVIDLEVNRRTETHFDQTGILNGQEKEQIVYDALGRKVSHTNHTLMVLDYLGGRFQPFVQQSITLSYAEDGETILSAVESLIPPVGHPDFPPGHDPAWGYALDEFGNILTQVVTYFEGDPAKKRIVAQRKIDCIYENVIESNRTRLIGMLLDKRDYARASPADPWVLINWIETEFNEKGQAEHSRFHFDRDDPQKVHLKSSEYDPYTGKLTRVYRHAGADKFLTEETRYYEDGPFRFLIKQVQNAKGQIERRERYDLRYRHPTSIIDRTGMTAETEFDAYGRPTAEIFSVHQTVMRRGAPKVSMRYSYTVTAQERSIETVNIHTGTRTKEYFDQKNRKIRVEGTGFQGRRVIETLAYDHRSREARQISEPYFEGESPAGFTIIERDDARLRTTQVRHPGGRILRHEYEGLTTRTYEDVFALVEDGGVGAHLQTRLISELTKDALGRTVRQAEGQPGQSSYYEIRNTYDLDNRLVEVKDNLGVTLRRVDYGSRLDELPVATWDVSLGHGKLEYDELGRLKVSRQDFKASLDRRTILTYDELDRIVEQLVEDTIDKASRRVRTTYDHEPFGVGAVAKEEVTETNSLGRYTQREEWDYDEFGNPTGKTFEWEIDWPGLGLKKSFRLQTGYSHDGEKGGRLKRLSYPSLDDLEGGEAVYEYDDLSGYLTSVSFGGAAVWRAGADGFNARGGVIETVFGNGVSTRYDYDQKTGLVTRSLTRRASATLLDQRILYDTAGSVRRRHLLAATLDDGGAEKVVTRTGSYDYDDKNQLTQAIEDERQHSFSYQSNGSRLSFVRNGEETRYHYEGRSPHQVTQLTGAQERRLDYDLAGNLVREMNDNTHTSRKLFWSPTNRLHKIEMHGDDEETSRRLYYGYSPDNDRIFMYDSLQDRLVLYGDDQFELELRRAEDRLILRSHLSNGARRFATVERESGQEPRLYYFHRDQVQSVTLVTGGAGEIASAIDYEPFGEVAQQTGSYEPGLLFTGHRAEMVNYEGFTLYDFAARWYDPLLAIFISPDPASDVKNVAFGFNRYVYVGNNPLSSIDPSGHEREPLRATQVAIAAPGLVSAEKRASFDKAVKALMGEATEIIHLDSVSDLGDALKKAHHPVFFDHAIVDGKEFYERYSTEAFGMLSAQAKNRSLTLVVCYGEVAREGFTAGVNEVMKGQPGPLLYATRGRVELKESGELTHGRTPIVPGEREVDLKSRLKVTPEQARKGVVADVFTDRKYGGTAETLVEMSHNKSMGGTALKVMKGIGGPGLKALDVYGRLQDGMELHQELKDGNYWNAAKKGISMGLDYVPNIHLQVFTTAYNVTDTINKLTNNYLPNKIADALLSVGADKIMAKAEAAISKVAQWFKSWW